MLRVVLGVVAREVLGEGGQEGRILCQDLEDRVGRVTHWLSGEWMAQKMSKQFKRITMFMN